MHRNLKKRLCDLFVAFLFEKPSKSLISSLSTLNKAHKPDGINKNKGACLQTKELKEILLFFYKLNKFRDFFSTNKVNAPLANLYKVISARCINGRVSSRSDIGVDFSTRAPGGPATACFCCKKVLPSIGWKWNQF